MAVVKKSVEVSEHICELCSGPLGETNWLGQFQDNTMYKQERPLKTKWYEALMWAYDGNPTYEVHHTCLYQLLKKTLEATTPVTTATSSSLDTTPEADKNAPDRAGETEDKL